MPIPRLRRTKYKKPRFPEGEWMLLVDANGAEDGPYRIADFQHLGDGVYGIQTAGHARYLRILEQKGNRIVSVDGGGERFEYWMVGVPADEVTGG